MKKTGEKEEETVSIKEAAALANCSERTVHNRIKSGKWRSWLQSDKDGPKRVEKRFIVKRDVLNEVLMKESSPGEKGEILPLEEENSDVMQGMQSLEKLRTSADTLANALDAHTRAIEKQSRRQLWSTMIAACACLAMVAGVIWYCFEIFPAF